MSEFHDPDLRQQLGRLSGPYPDDNVAFATWQRRVGQARRRRAMAWTTGAALSLVFGTVGVAALQGRTTQSVVPGKSSESSEEVTHSVATTEVEETTVETAAPDTTAHDTVAPETTPSSEVEAESSVPKTEGTEPADGSQGPSPTKGKGGSPTSAAPTAPQTATQTFSSTGGSITVSMNGDQLTVTGVHPAAGFHADQGDRSGRRVDVTFKSDNHESEISVKIVNGVMVPNVSDKADTPHQDSVPQDSGGGDHGDGGGGKP
jgi:cytoskeletal protein RodZ